MKFLLLACSLGMACALSAQTLTGMWQIKSFPSCKRTTGLFTQVPSPETSMVYAIQFESDLSGEEGLMKDDHNKLSKKHKFLYRQEDDNLYILDPKIQLIEGTYLITALSNDTLTLVNPRNTCEEFVFIRVKEL